MLDDRPYMRPEEPRFRGPSMQQPWSGWAILLTINVVVFLLQVLIDPSSLSTHMATFEKSFVGQWLALDSSQISWLLPIQLFTYQFLHGGVWHLLMNGLGLFFIGRALEPSIGRREVIGLYLVSGVVGALFQLGFAAVLPRQGQGDDRRHGRAFSGISAVGAPGGRGECLGCVASKSEHWDEVALFQTSARP